ncbi:MAG TPA: acetylglutamate kinase [Phnomibacter sp.]|nr:acetylglutamate kinase [Phnomibacter sp.]
MQKLLVIKIGGNVIDDAASLQQFLTAFASINTAHKILIHGGGKIATRIADKLGIESHYSQGRRITDEATLDVVTMVYGGLVNKQIVAQLQAAGCNAIGLTGADANLIPATKRPVTTIDYGWAGDVNPAHIPAHTLQNLLQAGLTPVFAPLTHNGQGRMLNTNADTIASALAISLSVHFEVRLMYCFEKPGVLLNVEDETSVITRLNPANYAQLKAEGALFEGIIPKIDNAFSAINAGVHEVLIGQASQLLQNTGSQTLGTLIVPS